MGPMSTTMPGGAKREARRGRNLLAKHALFLTVLVAVGCSSSGPVPYEGEAFAGGDTTNILAIGSQAFTFPATNVRGDARMRFFTGNAFFNQAWVAAPASTTARDGVGPLFHARSCSDCHFRDGRSGPPEDGDIIQHGVVKLAAFVDGMQVPEPTYGGQLQPFAIDGLRGRSLPVVTWQEEAGAYPDGTTYSLRRPTLTLTDPTYGPFAEGVATGIRMAPVMIGLGLLEAITEDDLRALADPEDEDGDGISGELQITEDGRIGRFGWRAGAPDVAAQSAGAFSGDMGLTTRLRPNERCTDVQIDCQESTHGGNEPGAPEVEDHIFDAVVLYSRILAVPARRGVDDPEVLAGRELMNQIGCTSCHADRFVTGAAALPELEDQQIFPYTDLLLHDMGEDLADGVGEFEASGSEWRTPPLWGVGLIERVNGHLHLLHDGRARGFEEAILWHGGEAEQVREAFRALPAEDRQRIVRFLESM